MLFSNKTPDEIADNIEKENADFVFLQELSYRNSQALKKTQAFKMYPYKQNVPIGETTGIATWSKYPLSEMDTAHASPFSQLRSVADVNGHRLVLWNVHINSPVRGANGVSNWKRDLTLLQSRLKTENGDILVAGDFNSTWTHKRFRNLMGSRFPRCSCNTRPWLRAHLASGQRAVGSLWRLDSH